MTGLRRRTLVGMGLVVGLGVATSYTISAVAVSHTVVTEQRGVAAERADAAADWLSDTAKLLSGGARDYGRWDDSWNYVRGDSPAYEVDSFNDASWTNLDLDAVLIGRPGAVFLAKEHTHSATGSQARALAAPLRDALERVAANPEPAAGLLHIGEEDWLYAAHPVTRNDGSGGDGTMWVAVRRMDREHLSAAERLAGGHLTLLAPGAPQPPRATGEAASHALEGGPGFEGWSIHLERADSATVAIREELGFVAANTAALGVLVILASLYLVDRLVLRRIAQLSAEVTRLRAGEADMRLTAQGTDELDQLAIAFNDLLDVDRTQRERLRFDALHDPLTGLANRALLLDRLRIALSRSGRSARVAALLFIDLDRIKRVNDHLGHSVGDRFIREIATRLRERVRPSDTVARLGGDEFAIVLEDIAGPEVAVARARAVLAVVREPLMEAGQRYELTASVGITLAGPGATAESLLKEADTAMYAAKHAGRDGWSLYDQDMHARVTRRLALEARLRAALRGPDVSVHFQPVVSLPGGELVGFEALARWTDPELGPIPPDEFIPVAEDGLLIAELDSLILERALEAFAPWHREFPGLFLSVNNSARRFETPDLAPQIAASLAHHGLPGAALILEVTETQFGKSEDRWCEPIQSLAAIGVRVALDDFGTGYSSLVRLRRVPVAILKLDRSFVQDLEGGRETVAVAIVQLAAALGLPVIAEGIEGPEAAARLAALGCAFGQGWHYGRPVPAEAAAGLVRAMAARRAG